jgi:hypothetical protein
MAKMGRKSAYDEKIKPFFTEILEMCQSMTDKQISDSLGVSYSTFLKYKAEKKEFSELLKKGRQNLVAELKGILIKRAKGYSYEEKKVIEDSKGYKKTETYTKYSHPDVASINLLLKNYDAQNWSNDPQVMELRKKELELKERQIESNLW